jgi:hypothetical protein
LPGASGSVRFMCAGNRIFVAKGTRNQKGLVAELVAARLGQLLGVPVGDVGKDLKGSPPHVRGGFYVFVDECATAPRPVDRRSGALSFAHAALEVRVG